MSPKGSVLDVGVSGVVKSAGKRLYRVLATGGGLLEREAVGYREGFWEKAENSSSSVSARRTALSTPPDSNLRSTILAKDGQCMGN